MFKTLISAAGLRSGLDSPSLCVIDCRFDLAPSRCRPARLSARAHPGRALRGSEPRLGRAGGTCERPPPPPGSRGVRPAPGRVGHRQRQPGGGLRRTETARSRRALGGGCCAGSDTRGRRCSMEASPPGSPPAARSNPALPPPPRRSSNHGFAPTVWSAPPSSSERSPSARRCWSMRAQRERFAGTVEPIDPCGRARERRRQPSFQRQSGRGRPVSSSLGASKALGRAPRGRRSALAGRHVRLRRDRLSQFTGP